MSSQTNSSDRASDSKYADELLDHDYDGIQEYDNPMPGWWKWLFYITIMWSAIYLVGINMGYLPSYEDDLADGQAELQVMRDQHQQESPGVDDTLLAEAADDSGKVDQGAQVYSTNCASCHGQNGEGLIGPNLTDEYWIHGGSLPDVYSVVKGGVTENGMPAWEGPLSQDEMVAVVAYVDSIRGSDPAGAKEPEGEPYEAQ
ncbi:MAG: cbb3-type cytochrome c oxidase N-terminal domain-containing protein [Persicimonas sp.]